jgi:hypothetical protein
MARRWDKRKQANYFCRDIIAVPHGLIASKSDRDNLCTYKKPWPGMQKAPSPGQGFSLEACN